MIFGGWFVKTLTGVLAIFWALSLFSQWRSGRFLKKARRRSGEHDPVLLLYHKMGVVYVAVFTVLLSLSIEAQVRASPDPYAAVTKAFYDFHLGCDWLYIGLFFALVVWNGRRSRTLHRIFAYGQYADSVVIAATGFWMLYQLPT